LEIVANDWIPTRQTWHIIQCLQYGIKSPCPNSQTPNQNQQGINQTLKVPVSRDVAFIAAIVASLLGLRTITVIRDVSVFTAIVATNVARRTIGGAVIVVDVVVGLGRILCLLLVHGILLPRPQHEPIITNGYF
jgi:hypothetical protein